MFIKICRKKINYFTKILIGDTLKNLSGSKMLYLVESWKGLTLQLMVVSGTT